MMNIVTPTITITEMEMVEVAEVVGNSNKTEMIVMIVDIDKIITKINNKTKFNINTCLLLMTQNNY